MPASPADQDRSLLRVLLQSQSYHNFFALGSSPMPLSSTPLLGFLYSMGTSEDLKCVKGVSYFKLNDEQDKEVDTCYAAMVNTESFVIPYKIHVDRYVIAEVNTQKNDAGDKYWELDQEWTKDLQSIDLLPASLPKYQIGMDSYLPAIGLGLLFIGWLAWVLISAASNAQQSEEEPSDNEQSDNKQSDEKQ
jgi:hypothetical protein